MDKRSFADILIELGLILSKDLEEIEELQTRNTDKSLDDLLLELNLITELDLIRAKAIFYQVPWVDLHELEIDSHLIALIPEKLARRHLLIPLEIQENGIHIAITNPKNVLALDEVQMISGLVVIPNLAMSSQIIEKIEHYYHVDLHLANQMIQQLEEETTEIIDDQTSEALMHSEVNQAPIIRLVNHLIYQALQTRASDIHIEPSRDKTRVRYRIDGVLAVINKLPCKIHPPLLSRLKIMSNLDISQHFTPQDGSIAYQYGSRDVDLRLSIIPTIYGEKAVIRILNQNSQILSLTDLGFLTEDLNLYMNLLQKNYGIILITGPTGSGKSTTLSSSIKTLSSPSINISTVEDPVEYKIDQINQIQVNEKTGLTFARALRSLLRQDPDVLMIGEIRDEETANIAIRAALTGHLVFSSLHTNNAVSTISRLTNMKIPLYLISSSLLGVVAQRLVRRICPDCRIRADEELQRLSLYSEKRTLPPTAFKGRGCPKCNHTGYLGRIGIFEILTLDNHNGEAVIDQLPENRRNWYHLFQGKDLMKDAFLKIEKGLTTVNEVLRVIV